MNLSNYPPGVTGNEFEIAGPDWEHEVEGTCDNGHEALVDVGYGHQRWRECNECDYRIDLPEEERDV